MVDKGISDVSELRAVLDNVENENKQQIDKNPTNVGQKESDTKTSLGPNNHSQQSSSNKKRDEVMIRVVKCDKNGFLLRPKLSDLMASKKEPAIPPIYLKCDLSTYNLEDLKIKFDTILVEPPLKEYQYTLGVTNVKLWSWDQIMNLKMDKIVADRCYIFLWCGSFAGQEKALECLSRWGFKYCESIMWLKTGAQNVAHLLGPFINNIFQSPKEYCVMGLRDSDPSVMDYPECKIDTIFSDKIDKGSMEKPIEMFYNIERFWTGQKRLHLFGRNSSLRSGWLTLGNELSGSNFDLETYNVYFNSGQVTTERPERVEELEPNSPSAFRHGK